MTADDQDSGLLGQEGGPNPAYPTDSFEGLTAALRRLDQLLTRAIIAAQSEYGASAAEDPYRGLYIRGDEVSRLLEREPGAPVLQQEPAGAKEGAATPAASAPLPRRYSWLGRWFGGGEETRERASGSQAPIAPATEVFVAPAAPELPLDLAPEEKQVALPLSGVVAPGSRLGWLMETYSLTTFDLDLLVIALAPELDLRYERLYAYLQDDVTRRRPSVDLALNLLCATAAQKTARRAHFAAEAPLIREKLIHLTPDRDEEESPLLANFFHLDGQIVRFLVGQQEFDPRLSSCCRVLEPSGSVEVVNLGQEDVDALASLVMNAWETGQPLRLYFHGPAGVGKRRAARAIASDVESPLLVLDLAQALSVDSEFAWLPTIAFREAMLLDAILYLEDIDLLREPGREIALSRFWRELTTDRGITILAGTSARLPAGMTPARIVRLGFAEPDFEERRELWRRALSEAGHPPDESDLDALAGRFRLSPFQIEEAVATAEIRLRWRAELGSRRGDGEEGPEGVSAPGLDELFAAAREQSGHDLADLAVRVEPIHRWENIVLPDDSLDQLREICSRVSHGHRVLDDWDFASKIAYGTGVMALFAGPSGTGKTMAADIIANELGLDLFKIDLAGVVSKYIGETEKNLERIFRAAENANAILLFDEADALFGKRSEVRDSHDRYANIEISYLLQKMEAYDGIAILATNLRQNLDDAFVRRMTFSVQFPFPDAASRLRIWEGIWPPPVPLAEDVDLATLAARFRLAGGNIKNVAVAAAFLAAEAGGPVTMESLLTATRREYQKMGKVMTEAELEGRPPDIRAPVVRVK